MKLRSQPALLPFAATAKLGQGSRTGSQDEVTLAGSVANGRGSNAALAVKCSSGETGHSRLVRDANVDPTIADVDRCKFHTQGFWCGAAITAKATQAPENPDPALSRYGEGNNH
jgi:hypothetical protein